MKITCTVERIVSLTHRSIVRCRYNLGSLRKCRKWKLLRVRPLISSPFSRGVHRAEPRLHIRFRLFLAIFAHSRGQIIRERCVELAARSFEREIAFSRGKIWRPAMGGKNLDYVSTRVKRVRGNGRTESSKHGVENRFGTTRWRRGY